MKQLILSLALASALMAGRRDGVPEMPTWDEIQAERRAPVKPQDPPCDTPEPGTIAAGGVALFLACWAHSRRTR